MAGDPETFWAYLLSEEPDKIQAAWNALHAEERAAVRAHLLQMTTDEGYSAPQRSSAQAALNVIATLRPAPPPED